LPPRFLSCGRRRVREQGTPYCETVSIGGEVINFFAEKGLTPLMPLLIFSFVNLSVFLAVN
jgi:hypothetical protein